MATNINQHFVIDDSGSMAPGIWGPKDPGRMAAVAACVEPVIPDCIREDKDGIDISTINTPDTKFGMTAPAQVASFISQIVPSMGTRLGNRMADLIKGYWEQYDKNPSGTQPKNFIIITDGEADDKPDLIKAILWCILQACMRETDPKQVTFFFLQVGEPEALGKPENKHEHNCKAMYTEAAKKSTKFLQELDDGLKDKFLTMLDDRVLEAPKLQKVIDVINGLPGKDLGPYDIVDTMPLQQDGKDLNADGVRKAMYGARYKELDSTNEGIHQEAAVKLD